ncbi:cell wall metabolism sensor histidine kinase WalK [Atopobium sp. oral taxon 199]|uniref:sensor histidine kinase n=1 Tax=Atopobium sp. oral taxon 199 TaxID=712156 RepID=UPI001E2BA6CA|nr:HAMP domain-containing sensor histidine kinase [Atopobium sp. oral taxon 199]
MDMLNRYADQYSMQQKSETSGQSHTDGKLDSQPKNKPENQPPEDKPDYELSTFYSVTFSSDGNVLSVYDGEKTIYSNDELTTLARQILNEGYPSGRKDNLSYVIRQKDGYILVAFMDNTVSEGGLRTMMRNVFIVGGASIVVLFFISVFLAERIIRPLEENDTRQKQFISNASHELKTPISVIGVNAEILSRELSQNEWLSNIQYENNRMGELVEQLLELSSAENKEVSMEELDFSYVVTGEALAFETLAFERGTTLQSTIEEEITLTGNQNQLTQVVAVLLDNALRHTTGNYIDLTLQKRAHNAVLSVTNDGKEIPPEKLEHLFDRFYRVDEARNSEDHHYGLGLSIAKAIVEKHGGSINVSCSGGKVTFVVVLPTKLARHRSQKFL